MIDVQPVGRADRQPINLVPASLKPIQVPVKSLRRCEEMAVREIAIENPRAVVGIKSCYQLIARGVNSLKMPWGNISRASCQSKSSHINPPSVSTVLPVRPQPGLRLGRLLQRPLPYRSDNPYRVVSPVLSGPPFQSRHHLLR